MGYLLMSYAFVEAGTVEAEGALPQSARRLDTGQWVMGLRDAPVELQQATGWFEVTDVDKPADTATHTYDRSITLVAGVPTVTWTQRLKTAEETAAATASTNQASIVTNLNQDMVAIQTILDTANATLNSNPAAHIKTMGRMLRRLGRTALNDYTDDD
jgi:hypothetical protein